MTARVCDASAAFAVLLDVRADGQWATGQLTGFEVAAPSQMKFECANIVRRRELAGLVSSEEAAQAHAELRAFHVDDWPYELLADRAWQLRANLTIYDATDVALAELLDAPLVTLDRRIGRAPGIACQVLTPP